ncbi:hypothetical protein PV-S19_0209 [Pacmanvirus S19]|nr:hypothetical protein PV-S19_0209 [Pacmanvirus S19]
MNILRKIAEIFGHNEEKPTMNYDALCTLYEELIEDEKNTILINMPELSRDRLAPDNIFTDSDALILLEVYVMKANSVIKPKFVKKNLLESAFGKYAVYVTTYKETIDITQ